MDRTRPSPPDPVEPTPAPVEGVDVPSVDTAVHAEGESSGRGQRQDQKQFAENEGLANTARPEVVEDVERPPVDPRDEMARAAQRGRTA